MQPQAAPGYFGGLPACRLFTKVPNRMRKHCVTQKVQ